MEINFNSGGKAVIDRIIEAYGFKTKLELCKHLNVSSGTLSMRYKRDFFPSDLVVRCMVETGASLEWLVTGNSDLPKKNPKLNQTETSLFDDTLEKLERLANLKEKGIITEQEFNDLKAKLI